jgi:hypothetical protein
MAGATGVGISSANIDTLLRIETRRARLLGLDAPTRVEQSGPEPEIRIITLEPRPTLAEGCDTPA